MARLARALLFTATTLCLVGGFGLCVFATNFLLDPSPELRSNLYARDVLFGELALGSVYVAAGIVGCCAGHRQARAWAAAFGAGAAAAAALQVWAAVRAGQQAARADSAAADLWATLDGDGRAALQQQLACAGAEACTAAAAAQWRAALGTTASVLLGALALPALALVAAAIGAIAARRKQPDLHQQPLLLAAMPPRAAEPQPH